MWTTGELMWRQWWAFVFQKMWDFLNSWATVSFSSGCLCRGVSSCVCVVSLAGWLDNKIVGGGGRKYCCLISVQSRHMPGGMEWICEECHDGVCVCVVHACCYIILLGIPPETKPTTFFVFPVAVLSETIKLIILLPDGTSESQVIIWDC